MKTMKTIKTIKTNKSRRVNLKRVKRNKTKTKTKKRVKHTRNYKKRNDWGGASPLSKSTRSPDSQSMFNTFFICDLVNDINGYIKNNINPTTDIELQNTIDSFNETLLPLMKNRYKSLIEQEDYMCNIFKDRIPIVFKPATIIEYGPAIKKYFCFIFLVIGIISNTLLELNICTILLKGGKAIQLLSKNTSISYESDDIDILIIPHETTRMSSKQIAELICSLITKIDPNMIYTDLPRDVGSIMKLSLNLPDGRIIAIADIGYDDISTFSPVLRSVISNGSTIQHRIEIASGCTTRPNIPDRRYISFNHMKSGDLVQEYLYWVIYYHTMNQRQRPDDRSKTLANSAFIDKSGRSINTLLRLINLINKTNIVDELNKTFETLEANYLSVFFTQDDNKVKIISDVRQMILNPQSRVELFRSPIPEDSRSTSAPPRLLPVSQTFPVRSPLQIRSKNPLVSKFTNAPPTGPEIQKPIPTPPNTPPRNPGTPSIPH